MKLIGDIKIEFDNFIITQNVLDNFYMTDEYYLNSYYSIMCSLLIEKIPCIIKAAGKVTFSAELSNFNLPACFSMWSLRFIFKKGGVIEYIKKESEYSHLIVASFLLPNDSGILLESCNGIFRFECFTKSININELPPIAPPLRYRNIAFHSQRFIDKAILNN